MMELRHIRYFEAVAEERNFTRAAERLGVAQPPLSRQIRELEIELGVTLFDRESRPVRLTDAGRIFHDQATQILSAIEQLKRSMQRVVHASRRRYMIGFVASVVYGAMPDVVRRFRSEATDLDIQLLEMTTLEQVSALKEGRIDAGLGRIIIDDAAISRVNLANEPLSLAISTGHRLAYRDHVSVADLINDRLIIYPNQPRPSYADQVLQFLHNNNFYPEALEEVRDVQVALGLVASQVGVSIVPRSMNTVNRPDIKYIDFSDPEAISPILLSTRVGDITQATRTLHEISKELYSLQYK